VYFISHNEWFVLWTCLEAEPVKVKMPALPFASTNSIQQSHSREGDSHVTNPEVSTFTTIQPACFLLFPQELATRPYPQPGWSSPQLSDLHLCLPTAAKSEFGREVYEDYSAELRLHVGCISGFQCWCPVYRGSCLNYRLVHQYGCQCFRKLLQLKIVLAVVLMVIDLCGYCERNWNVISLHSTSAGLL
jgi:hypothetical protein